MKTKDLCFTELFANKKFFEKFNSKNDLNHD